MGPPLGLRRGGRGRLQGDSPTPSPERPGVDTAPFGGGGRAGAGPLARGGDELSRGRSVVREGLEMSRLQDWGRGLLKKLIRALSARLDRAASALRFQGLAQMVLGGSLRARSLIASLSSFPLGSPGKVHLELLGLERGAEVEVGGDGKG